jgi:transposase
VSGLEPLKENIKVYLKHSWYLFNFHARHPYRKWRFTASVMAPKAMKQIIDRLIGKNEKVLIGFGDWSQQDGFLRGSDTAPVKKFKRELRKRATVVKIDEYCTSQTCSKCHLKEMVNEVYDGEECHQVLKCKTCKTYWQRDHNASVNIYGLLIGMVNGEERLEAMRRVVAPQRGRKKAKIGT